VNRLISITGIALAAGFFSLSAVAGNNGNGNGAPSGSHYNLNIIGVDKGKSPNMKASGHVIFVNLGKTGRVSTKIWLTEGDFAVTDKNGTDGEAGFQLPKNDCEAPIDSPVGADCTNETEYTVWIRALGAPGGNAVITTCRTDEGDTYGDVDNGGEYCSTESVSVTSETGRGKKTFENVTKELTTLCLDTYDDGNFDGNCDIREQLFDWGNELYWWDYDNYGLRLAQLRFYPLGE